MKKIGIIISPNWKNYAQKYLDDCVDSLRKQDYSGEINIYITDNESTPESYNYLKEKLPEARIHRNLENAGFAKGNNDSIKIAMADGCYYIILFNMDTIIYKSCVTEMVRASYGENVAAVQARLMLWPEKDLINSMGNSTHFLGYGYCLNYKDKIKGLDTENHEIFYPSGAAVLFKTKILKKIGLFDEEYVAYNEDQELPWRMRLAGYKILIAPKAVVYHKYNFQRSSTNIYYLDRNRIISILKCYHIGTLILILPAFILMELGYVFFPLKEYGLKEKKRVWKFFLKISTWKYIYKARQEAQKQRIINERQIIKFISGKIKYQEIESVGLTFFNFFFNIYWHVIKLLIFW